VITNVTNNVEEITQYQGAHATDPVARNDGTPLQVGDLYFNTVINELKVWTGTSWVPSSPGSITVQNFTGTGAQTAFNLASAPVAENNTQIYIDGVYQQKDTYTLAGATITFSAAPPYLSGIEVVTFSISSLGTTDASNVSYNEGSAGAVNTSVQAKLQESVSVKDFGAVGNGVTDDTAAIQAAIDSDPNGLFFPEGTYVVSPVSAQNYCLLVDSKTVRIYGDFAVISMASTDNKQAMRLVNSDNCSISGLKFLGSGTNGADGGQGILQLLSCDNSTITNTQFINANGDGLAASTCSNLIISHCIFDNCSKSSIYPNASTGVVVSGNIVKNIGGHTVSGNIVGTGIQSSGNTDCTISDNTIIDGLGIGILCNESGSTISKRTSISGNTVKGITNPSNINVSGGIRLSNGATDKACGTLVEGNFVQACGINNYYIENHNGAKISDNTGVESDRSNFVISTIVDATVQNNTAINTNTSNTATRYAFSLINGATGVIGGGNRSLNSSSFATSYGSHTINDGSGNNNKVVRVKDYEFSEFSFTWQPNSGSSIANGASVSANFTGITGFALGDYILVSAPYSLNDCIVSAYPVSSAGTVRLTLFNSSGSARTFASGTWTIRVFTGN
jgi:polygalacturonase